MRKRVIDPTPAAKTAVEMDPGDPGWRLKGAPKRASNNLPTAEERRKDKEILELFKDRVLVSFQTTTDPDGDQRIKVGFNGHQFFIPREKPYPIPRVVLEQMKRCSYRVFTEDKENSSKGNIVYKASDRRRFPYTVLADPAPFEEVQKMIAANRGASA